MSNFWWKTNKRKVLMYPTKDFATKTLKPLFAHHMRLLSLSVLKTARINNTASAEDAALRKQKWTTIDDGISLWCDARDLAHSFTPQRLDNAVTQGLLACWETMRAARVACNLQTSSSSRDHAPPVSAFIFFSEIIDLCC